MVAVEAQAMVHKPSQKENGMLSYHCHTVRLIVATQLNYQLLVSEYAVVIIVPASS